MNPGRLSPTINNLMIDKIQGAIQHWSCNFLSYAGKLQLINAVVFGLENFWCSALLLPLYVTRMVNKLCKDFFWGIIAGQRNMSYKSWNSICAPWGEGGFNVKELLSWNKALLSKWVWQLTTHRDCLWDSWSLTYNLKGKSIWEGHALTCHGESWRDIIKVKDALLELAGSKNAAFFMLNSCVSHGKFMVGRAYSLFRQCRPKLRWTIPLRSDSILPKHRICVIGRAEDDLLSLTTSTGGVLCSSIDVAFVWLLKSLIDICFSDAPSLNSWRNILSGCSVAGMVYAIWEERNNRLFGGIQATPEMVASKLQSILKIRLSDNQHPRIRQWLDFTN
ncbi:uncharacterized protein LOC141607480 [Silene latifolia]|uniref:uncharacterized protein LOC141607480 n=1 Tax=Silene latifolia TaxID=37657 RepID=UPI003D77478B